MSGPAMGDKSSVSMGGVQFDPREEQISQLNDKEDDAPQDLDRVTGWIVQFHEPLAEADVADLRGARGLALTDFVPQSTYIERLSSRDADALRDDPRVRAVAEFRGRFKVASNTLQVFAIDAADEEDDAPAPVPTFDAVLFADSDPGVVSAVLESRGAESLVIMDDREIGGGLTLRFALPDISRIDALSEVADVRWLEPVPETVDDGPAGQPGTVTTFHALHGEGQILGLIDRGQPDIDHCFFQDPAANPGLDHRKVLQVRNAAGTESSDHATFAAGCAVGDDRHRPGASPDRGIAWAAKLVSGNRLDLKTTTLFAELTRAGAAGARVHSNSYHSKPQGSGNPAIYEERSRYVDEFTWVNEEHLVVASSGNSDEEQGPPGTAKNALCVSCAPVDPADAVGDGNPGPTADGRRKPELMGVACRIRSALRGTVCETTELTHCASSYATPRVAGAALIARQYFVEGYHPSGVKQDGDALVPSGALLKAVLLNAAASTGGARPYPNDAEGWGVLDLADFLPLGPDARRLWVSDVRNAVGLVTGEKRSQELVVADAATPLKITLAWTDPPGASGADDPVVNDLDLIVTAPDGSVYLGNVLSGGASVEGGLADRVNNTEMALHPSPVLGPWIIEVHARRVTESFGRQGFALVVSGGLATA